MIFQEYKTKVNKTQHLNMSDNITGQQQPTLVQAASRIAIKTGILCSISFVCSIRGITSPGLATIGHITALWAIYDIFKQLVKYRLFVQDIRFGKCLKMAFLICIFAGLLTNMVQYLYFQFFDKGLFLSTLASLMETPEYKEIINIAFSDIPQSQWNEAFHLINIQTLMTEFIMMNLLLSVPVSLLTAGIASVPKIKSPAPPKE
jgi:hypothetical protein